MQSKTPSSLLNPRSSKNLLISGSNHLNRLPSFAISSDHLAVRPSKFNLNSNKYLQSPTGRISLSKQNLDDLTPPMMIRIVVPSKNDLAGSQVLKTPVDAQAMRLSSFMYLTPSTQLADPAEAIKNSKTSFSVLSKPSKSIIKITLKDKINFERQRSEKKIKTLQRHFDQNEGLPVHLREKYVSIVKNLDDIKIRSIEEEMMLRKNKPWNLRTEPSEMNLFESSNVRIRNAQDITRYSKRLLKIYNLVNKEKLWKRT